ncbi:MAG TPA: MFS transporter [Anaerolineales bacterium]|nr:MFS transporter [Anaerolineales bacterium]
MKKLNAPPVYLLAMFIAGLTTKLVFTTHIIYRVQLVGMDALQLVLAGTALEIAVFLFEVPTGIVADIYSRRLSTLLGFFITGIALGIEGLAPLFSLVVLSQALLGFGFTFISGAFSAWITDEVGVRRVGELFLRGRQLTLLGSLAGIPIGVMLAESALALPFILGGLIRVTFGIFLFLFMPETGFTPIPKAARTGWKTVFVTFSEGVAVVRKSSLLLTFALIALFVGLYSEAWDRLAQAHLLEIFVFPAIGGLELDPIAWFGLLNTAFIVFSLASNEIAKRLVDTARSQRILRALESVYATMVLAIFIFAVSGSFYLSIAVMILFDAVRSVSFPLTEAWLNQQIKSNVRATVLSMAGQLDAFGEIAAGPALGAVGRWFSTQTALIMSALILSPAAPLYRRIQRLSGKEKA